MDPLNRPLPQHLIPEMPSASDLILASGRQRFLAFCIDLLIIYTLFFAVMFYFFKMKLPVNNSLAALIFYGIWAIYVVAFSVSKKSATIGQRISSIHLYSLFSSHISLSAALARFVLLSYPMAVSLIIASNLFAQTFIPDYLIKNNAHNVYDVNITYTILVIAWIIQIILIWPLLNGNYRRISWDEALRCCVIRQKLNYNIAKSERN